MLDRGARSRRRTLSKPNADHVARHLVMAGRLVDVDPEVAYEHAREAMRSAGRVDIVREAVALTAYATGRYAEALREVRTVRRLSGIDAHPAIEADCERGLGRPERAWRWLPRRSSVSCRSPTQWRSPSWRAVHGPTWASWMPHGSPSNACCPPFPRASCGTASCRSKPTIWRRWDGHRRRPRLGRR